MSGRYAVDFSVSVEEISRQELLSRLADAGIEQNKYSKALLAMPTFQALKAKEYWIRILSVADLELGAKEATLCAMYARAQELGYGLCPLELAPFLPPSLAEPAPEL